MSSPDLGFSVMTRVTINVLIMLASIFALGCAFGFIVRWAFWS